MNPVLLFRRLAPRLRFVLTVAGLSMVVFTVLRLVFWTVYRSESPTAAPGDIALAFYLGFKFDLRLVLFIGVPPLLFGTIPLLDPVRRAGARRFWIGYYVVVLVLTTFLYAVDLGHYGYTHMRLNASLIEHLTPVSIALKMAWETYPVIPGLLGLAVFGAGCVYVLRRVAAPELDRPRIPMGKWSMRALAAMLSFLYLFGMYGKWSWYPLRWSDAYFTEDSFLSALALNPVLFLNDTLKNRNRRFDDRRVRAEYGYIADRLEVKERDPKALSFARTVLPRVRVPERPNLVVIHLESFAAYRTGIFGNPMQATPNFDAIARQGVLFRNFFVGSAPTARSVFTMLTGIPDYNPGDAASRDPLIIDQHTLVNALDGYARFYFIGGSAAWGNVRGILAHNIAGLHVYEEGAYEQGRTDAWGVSDFSVYEQAHTVFTRQDKPFFAFIQTSGNHRPYGIPDNPREREGFDLVTADEQAVRATGIESVAALNGLRYFDYSLGHFFRLAAKSPYYRNTVFLLYGDHGNPSTANLPFDRLGLTGVHVPFVVFWPGHLAGGRVIDSVASSADLLPTALGLMGVPYVNTGIGRDLLAPRPAAEQFALIPDGALTNEFLLRDSARGGYHLYRYRSATPTVDVAAQYPDKVAELGRLRETLRDTARYMLQHNPPRPHPGKAAR